MCAEGITGECSWDPRLWWSEGSRTRKEEKLSCGAVVTMGSVNPTGGPGAGMSLQICSVSRQGAQALFPASTTDCGLSVGVDHSVVWGSSLQLRASPGGRLVWAISCQHSCSLGNQRLIPQAQFGPHCACGPCSWSLFASDC